VYKFSLGHYTAFYSDISLWTAIRAASHRPAQCSWSHTKVCHQKFYCADVGACSLSVYSKLCPVYTVQPTSMFYLSLL